MNLYDEFDKIIQENRSRITTSLIMDVIDELSSIICESFAKELNVHYEEVEAKLLFAKEKIKRIIESKDANAD